MNARLLSELMADLKAFFEERSCVMAAAIFGSVARGTDTAESDIDVIVLGDLSELRINADLGPLGRKYAHKINAGVWTVDEIRWLIAEGNTIIYSILSGQLIPLKGALPSLPDKVPSSTNVVAMLDDSEHSKDIEFNPNKLDLKLKPPKL